MGHRPKNHAFSMVRKIAGDGRVTPDHDERGRQRSYAIALTHRERPHDWRVTARSVFDIAQVAVSAGLLVAVASHLAGATTEQQGWISAAMAGVAMVLRIVKVI